MAYFNRDSSNRSGRDNRGGGRGFSSGGRSSFGRGGRDSGRSNDGPREMFKTVCSNCNKECEVPFRPTTGKPVYCSDCFEKMGGRNSDSARPERDDRPRRDDRPQAPRVDNSKNFDDLNSKLDKIIALLTPRITEDVVVPVVEKEIKTPKIKKVKVTKEVVTS